MSQYKILGLSETADSDQIKKAYRKLSLKYHPDKIGGDKEMFHKINEAYNYLVNNRNQISQNTNDDIKNLNINQSVITVNLKQEQVYSGTMVPVKIERRIIQQNILKTTEHEMIYIDIKPGTDNNEIIQLNEKGDIINGIKQDIRVKIKVQEEPNMKRDGLDIIYTHSISVKDFLCGFCFWISHPDGKRYKINNPPGSICEQRIILNNMGYKRDKYTGNLIIVFEIYYPKEIEIEKIEQIKKLL